jgi:murein DD-endopeptidase MepM/ murein hydrolase activator NlpD
MIPDYTSPAGAALGDQIARFYVAKRTELGVKYVIWRKRIWSVARQSEGWRPYSGISPHYDHVHVSTYGDSAGEDVVGGPGASNQSGSANGSSSANGPAVLPLASVVMTARFGQCSSLWARCHTGLDMSAGTGTPIRAVLGGRVVSSGWAGAYGQLTKIEARPGLQFWYAHQSARSVRVGQVVRTGQVIGRVGMTGNTTGPHLHFEVRQGGSAKDPEAWLNKQGLLRG